MKEHAGQQLPRQERAKTCRHCGEPSGESVRCDLCAEQHRMRAREKNHGTIDLRMGPTKSSTWLQEHDRRAGHRRSPFHSVAVHRAVKRRLPPAPRKATHDPNWEPERATPEPCPRPGLVVLW
jgi:hypothetical protein